MKKIRNILIILSLFILPMISHAAVTVETLPVTDIGKSQAVFNGKMTNTLSNGSTSNTIPLGTIVYFRYSEPNVEPPFCGNFLYPTSYSKTIINPQDLTFKAPSPTGLQPNTDYYICTVASNSLPNSGPIKTGNIVSFRTLGSDGKAAAISTIGKVTTGDPQEEPFKSVFESKLKDTEVILKGSFATGYSGSGSLYGYFRYSKVTDKPPLFCNDIYGSNMQAVTATNPNSSGLVTPGSFYGYPKNLAPDTEYSYCAVVSNSASQPTEIEYGQVETFRTAPCSTCDKTKVITKYAKDITSKTATLYGSFSSTKASTTYFEYKEVPISSSSTPDPFNPNNLWSSTPTKNNDKNTYGGMQADISKLKPYTWYQFKAIAETSNPSERFEGNVYKFKTHAYDGVGNIPEDTDVCPAGFTGVYPDCVDPNGGIDNGGNGNNLFPKIDLKAIPVTQYSAQIPFQGKVTIVPNSWIIEWTSENTFICNAGAGHPTETEANFSTGVLSQSRSYSVTCTGENGTAGDTVFLYVNNGGNNGGGNNGNNLFPQVSVLANPNFISKGGSSTISWQSTNTTSCNAGGGNSTNTSGSFNTGPLENGKSYTIICSGTNGSASDTANISINTNTPGGPDNIPDGDEDPGDDGNPGDDSTSGGNDGGNNNSNGNTSGGNGTNAGGSNGNGNGGNGTGTNGNITGGNGGTTGGGTLDDIDGDGITNDNDTDIDGDGFNNNIDTDIDGDGIVNTFDNDVDGDGIPNNTDTDIDGDGVLNTNDTTPNGAGSIIDIDNDGVVNGSDIDMDGDGILNIFDNDIDGDGIPNTTDTDDDGDGIPDSIDSTPKGGGSINDFDGDGFNNDIDSDIDGDGIPNIFDNDVDGDGVPNSTDTDDDGDGVPDLVDTTPKGAGSINDIDGGGIPNQFDSDMDGDGIVNVLDNDTDGDGIPNDIDTDDDNDGIPDYIDSTPTGVGNVNDYDGGGIPNQFDSDMDGDGIPNEFDTDTDGDGIPNSIDPDDDNDGIPDAQDLTPTGVKSTTGKILKIGDTAEPDIDDIVRYHEGIEHVFIRRIMKSSTLQQRYGYVSGTSLQNFANDLAHTLAKDFGYVNSAGQEIRVSMPDVSAYQLRLSGNKLTVYEYYKNKIVDIRSISSSFKNKNPYEYYFTKR